MFRIVNNFNNANMPRTVRFTEKMFEQLNSIAQKNNISFNLLVLQCCQYAIDHTQQGNNELDDVLHSKSTEMSI